MQNGRWNCSQAFCTCLGTSALIRIPQCARGARPSVAQMDMASPSAAKAADAYPQSRRQASPPGTSSFQYLTGTWAGGVALIPANTQYFCAQAGIGRELAGRSLRAGRVSESAEQLTPFPSVSAASCPADPVRDRSTRGAVQLRPPADGLVEARVHRGFARAASRQVRLPHLPAATSGWHKAANIEGHAPMSLRDFASGDMRQAGNIQVPPDQAGPGSAGRRASASHLRLDHPP